MMIRLLPKYVVENQIAEKRKEDRYNCFRRISFSVAFDYREEGSTVSSNNE